jgi:hypothetical protein
VLAHRCAPAGPGVLPAWRACPAGSAGLADAVPASGSGPVSVRDGATRETRPVSLPLAGPARSRLISSKSFLYHFAVKALLPLI